MRYLITGGAGFIGSHLAEELLRRGDEVFVVDDLSTGSINNIRHLKTHDRFHYTIDSCANHHLMAELVDACDKIYHLAAAVGVKLIVESPVRTIETNIRLTEVMLGLANKKKRPIFIASTSEVYGKSEQFPFNEEGELVMGATTKGRWSYSVPAARRSTSSWQLRTGRRSACRPWWRDSSTRSARARPGSTEWSCRTSCARRSPASRSPSSGDGKQSRCFTHVSDVIRAFIECAAA